MEAVAAGAPKFAILRGEPGGKQPPDVSLTFHLEGVLAGKQHDLPPAMIAGTDDESCGPCGITARPSWGVSTGWPHSPGHRRPSTVRRIRGPPVSDRGVGE